MRNKLRRSTQLVTITTATATRNENNSILFVKYQGQRTTREWPVVMNMNMIIIDYDDG